MCWARLMGRQAYGYEWSWGLEARVMSRSILIKASRSWYYWPVRSIINSLYSFATSGSGGLAHLDVNFGR